MSRDTPLSLVLSELEAVGLEPLVTEGKHWRVTFVHQGQRHLYIVPKTTGDRRAMDNNRCGIRRLLRQLSLLRK